MIPAEPQLRDGRKSLWEEEEDMMHMCGGGVGSFGKLIR